MAFTHYQIDSIADTISLQADQIIAGHHHFDQDPCLRPLLSRYSKVYIEFSKTSLIDLHGFEQILALQDWAWNSGIDLMMVGLTGQVMAMATALQVTNNAAHGRFDLR